MALDLSEYLGDSDVSVNVSGDGSKVLLAPWADGKAAKDLLLVSVSEQKAYLVDESAGAERFALKPDGTELVFVKDEELNRLCLNAFVQMETTPYTGNALQYTADGGLVIYVNEDDFTARVYAGAEAEPQLIEFADPYLASQAVLGHVDMRVAVNGAYTQVACEGVTQVSKNNPTLQYQNASEKNRSLQMTNLYTASAFKAN